MLKKQIIELQSYLKVEPDGFWGEKSIVAAQKHLRKLMASAPPSPKTDQASLTAAYGAAGDESNLVNLNVEGLGVKYDGKLVKTVRCNKVVAPSLLMIIKELATFQEGVDVLAEYGGCYNNRPMRGGTTPSLHARGAAIDLAPNTNANKQHWPISANMSFVVMEVFAKHGWLAAGAFWSRDAMHMQKTQ